MANWILFARGTDGKPVVSAMQGEKTEKSLNGDKKADLIKFLTEFAGVGTFAVAKPEGAGVNVEAVDLLPQEDADATTGTPVTPNGTWFQFFRNGTQPVVVAMRDANGVELYNGNIKSNLIAFLNRHASAGTFQLAPASTQIPKVPAWKPTAPATIPVTTPEPKPVNKFAGKKVMLEVGHGPLTTGFDPGAIAHDGKTTEHELNTIAAQAARNVLVNAGLVNCVILDTPQPSLREMGLKTAGFDVFCSIHHNSVDSGTAQRAEVFSHATKGDDPDRKLADIMSAEIAKELDILNGGAKTANFGVLSGAEDTNVKASVLAELYFINFKGGSIRGKNFPKPDLKDYSKRGGEAIGRAILNFFDNKTST